MKLISKTEIKKAVQNIRQKIYNFDMNTKGHVLDWTVIIIIPIATAIIAKLYSTSLLLEVLMFFGLPPLYLFLRDPSIIKKTVLFSLVPWWPLTIVWEYLVFVDRTWFVPSMFRLFRESLPLEDIFWGILFLVYGIAVWEHFFNESKLKERLFNSKFKYLVGFLYVSLFFFMVLYYFRPEVLYVPYFFAWLGTLFCVIPIIFFLLKNPKMFKKLMLVGMYFFLPFSLMDYTALTKNQWWFPGRHYLGTVMFFGHVLPWDEILFFWILSMPALVCWYEYFADDEK